MTYVARVVAFIGVAAMHLGDRKWFTRLGLAAMWAGAGCAARRRA
jgi:hypothetical protein